MSMTNNTMTPQELEEHIRYFKNDPETLRRVCESGLVKAVGIQPNDAETVQMLVEVIIRKMAYERRI